MRKAALLSLLAVLLAAPPSLFADFSYQETTQITGGSLLGLMQAAGALSSQARQATSPIVSNVYLKGNRLARVSPQTTVIIDLDKQSITTIDSVKHTYTVVTFEQMKQQLAQVQAEMEKKQAEAPANSPSASNVKMSFDVHVRKTGSAQQMSGVDTNEAILTLVMNATDTSTQQNGAMGITNDMWLAQQIPGYDQLRAFYQRMGEQMGDLFSGSGSYMSHMLGGQPGANEALSSLTQEMRKLDGVPVLQVMRMGATSNGQPLPAASEAPLPANPAPQTPSAGDVAQQSASSSAANAISSRLGGLGGAFGGFGHKKQAPPPDQPAPAAGDSSASSAPPTNAVLMETRTESANFSTDSVDEIHFQVPQGYQQIQAQNLTGN